MAIARGQKKDTSPVSLYVLTMNKSVWKFLGLGKGKSHKPSAKDISSPSPTKEDTLKELLGSWIYDNIKGVGVVITDRKGIIKHFNVEAQALTSIPGDAAKGKQLAAIFPTLSYDFQAQLGENKFAEKELSFPDSKRKQKWFKLSLGPLLDPLKGSVGFALVFEDITDQKEIRERLRLEQEMSTARERVLVEEQEGLFGGAFEVKGIIGQSQEMGKVYRLIKRVAPTNSNVLITGETGTGKEAVARAIHDSGPRHDKPFVPLNCGAIPENLLEDELFGHVRGAFTDAVSDRKGYFQQAEGGTIFLDDVGGLPQPVQARLTRIMEDKAFVPMGGTKKVSVDVRVISASNEDLRRAVERNQFRRDLFYRLSVIHIALPPLRERKEDLPLLVRYLLKKFANVHNKPVETISSGALMWLGSYNYPGNIWQLENIIEHAVVVTTKNIITEEDLPPEIGGLSIREEIELLEKTVPGGMSGLLNAPVSIEEELATHEKCLLLAALKKANHVQKRAAELLGINYRSFRHRLEKYGYIEQSERPKGSGDQA